jgi:hypothetical protein
MLQRLMLLSLISGCGGAPEAESRATATSSHVDLAMGYRAPNTAIELARSAVDFAVRALAVATQMTGTGEVRAYGTLTEAGDGRISYQSAPADRLLINRPGAHVEIEVIEVDGSGSDARSFLDGNHRVRVRFKAQDEVAAEVWSNRAGSRRQYGIAGRAFIEGEWWNADLEASGVESFDVDQSGSRFFDEHDVGGFVESDRSRVDVQEHWRFELVSAAEGIGSRMGSASSAVRSVGNVLRIGGDRFEWIDARTQKAFRNGKPTELDTFWMGTGRIERNGRPVARVEKFASIVDPGSGGFVGFQLVTDEGTIELERHQAY